jgi:anthranilate phosphoribosyltransferase
MSAKDGSGRSRYAGFRSTIKAVGTGPRGSRALSFEEARAAMAAVLAGETTDAQAGAFLIAMRVKGEEPQELAGLAQALREAALTRESCSVQPIACAGAYDGVTESPQLSLAASAIAAACGAPCVVHCGDSLGPKYGTTPADVLHALGGNSRPSLEQSRAMLETSGVAVVHTGEAIPGWERLARIRDEVGLRGPVHSAEKMVDHFAARRFVVGYSHQPYGPRLVSALGILGADSSLAVRGIEGSDVPRPARPQASGDGAFELPQSLGLKLPRDSSSPQTSAELTRAILSGADQGGAAVAALIGAVLRASVAGLCESFQAGMARARSAVATGEATRRLERMLAAAT